MGRYSQKSLNSTSNTSVFGRICSFCLERWNWESAAQSSHERLRLWQPNNQNMQTPLSITKEPDITPDSSLGRLNGPYETIHTKQTSHYTPGNGQKETDLDCFNSTYTSCRALKTKHKCKHVVPVILEDSTHGKHVGLQYNTCWLVIVQVTFVINNIEITCLYHDHI